MVGCIDTNEGSFRNGLLLWGAAGAVRAGAGIWVGVTGAAGAGFGIGAAGATGAGSMVCAGSAGC